MSIHAIRQATLSVRNNSRKLVDAFLKRSDIRTPSNGLEPLEPRQMLSAIPDWVNTIGTQGSSNSEAIATADDGSIYIGGAFTGTFDFNPGAGVAEATAGNEFGDGFVVKYDANGNFIWLRHFKGNASGSTYVNDISLDDDGNLYIGGRFDAGLSVDFGAGAQTFTSKGQSDIFLAKVTPTGSLGYMKQLGSNSSDQFFRFVTTRSSDIIFSGLSFGNLDLDLGAGVASTSNALSSSQSFLVRYTPEFTYQTHLALNGINGFSFGAFGDSVLVADKDTLYVTGNVRRDANLSLADGTVLHSFVIPEHTTFPGTGNAAFLAKIDTSESLKLTSIETFESTRDVGTGALGVDPFGNVYFGINYTGDLDLNPQAGENKVSGGGSSIPALVSFNASGAFRFGHTLNAIGEIRAIDVVSDPDNIDDTQIFIGGDFSGTASFDLLNSDAGKRKSNTTGSTGFVWIMDEHANFVDAAAFYSAKGGLASSGSMSVRAVDAIFDGPLNIAGSFRGIVDFDASLTTFEKTSVGAVSFDSNAFVASYSSAGVADADGTGTGIPTGANFAATSPSAVNEDSGLRTITNWAVASQNLTYEVQVTANAALLFQGPAVSAAGTLTYTPADDAFGTVDFKVRATDGSQTSDWQTFAIVINPVNDAPSFTAANPPAVVENSGLRTITNWAVGSTGPTNETGQTLSYSVEIVSGGSILTGVPSVSSTGTLTYTPAKDQFGEVSYKVRASDGINQSEWQAFTLSVTDVPETTTLNFSQGKSQTITVPGGNKVTFSLTGAGTGTITLSKTNELLSVQILGSTATTGFKVAVSGKANGGTATIGSISIGKTGDASVDAIGTVDAAKLNIAQGVFSVEGTAAKVTLSSLNDVGFAIGSTPTAGTALNLGTVLNTDLNVNGTISSLDVLDWDNNDEDRGDVFAKAINKINSKGDFEASLTLSGAAKGATLGAVSVVGAVNDSKWDINGDTGALKIGGINHVSIQANSVQGVTIGALGLMDASLTFKSVGAFAVGGKLDGVDLVLQNTGNAAKLLKNLTSFTVTGAANELFVATGAFTSLGAFTFKNAASHIQISGASAGAVGNIAGTSVDSLTVSAGTLGTVAFSGNASHITLSSASKIGALNFKGDLSQAIINLTGSPAKPQVSLTSLTVGGNVFEVTLNGANANHNIGAVSIAKSVDILDFNVSGDIASIKTGSMHALHLNKVGKVGSIAVKGDLTGGTIDALAVTGAFTVSGAATDNDITLNTSRTATQPTSFKALGSLAVNGPVNGINLSATGANSNFGSIAFKNSVVSGNFSTSATIAGISGVTGSNINISAGSLKSLAFSGNINSLSIEAAGIGGFTAKGNLADANIVVIAPTSAKDFTAVGPISVTGATSSLSILSSNVRANFGAMSLGASINNVTMNIAGDIASFKGGSADKFTLISTGTVGAFTVGGAFTNSTVDVVSLGATTVSGNLNGVGISVNTDQPLAQPVGFKALASLTVKGATSGLSLTAADANSNVGALTFSQGLTNSVFDLRANVASLTSKGSIDTFVGTLTDLKTFSVTGNVTNTLITSLNVGSVSISGNVNTLGLTLNLPGSSSNTNLALSSLKIGGASTNLSVSGNGLNSNIGSIAIAGASLGTNLNIRGNLAKISALSFDSNTVVSVLGKVSAVSTAKGGSIDGSFIADSFGSITIGGDLAADIRSGGAGGIGAVNVTGNINGALLRALGSITSITANAILNSNILSGYDNTLGVPSTLPTVSTGFVNPAAVIGTITIKSTSSAASFVNSKVMGIKIGAVNLKVVDTTNDGNVIGFSATKELGPVTRTGAPKVNKITLPSQSQLTGDFALRIVV